MSLIRVLLLIHNYSRYAKMQSHSLPSSMTALTFDIIVPQSTSTRHVAASAFYHCLGALYFVSFFDPDDWTLDWYVGCSARHERFIAPETK